MAPNVYIVAGPNGAGKTTFAREFLPNYVECLEFVNADLIELIGMGLVVRVGKGRSTRYVLKAGDRSDA